jgi:hypothetical protein
MTYLPDCGDGIDAPDCLTCEGTGGLMDCPDWPKGCSECPGPPPDHPCKESCPDCSGTGHMSLDDERELAADAACHAGMESDF